MAVVRLKRRFDENPVNVLLFASKRLKTDDNSVDPTLFTFAATVTNKEEDSSASACVNKVLQSEQVKTESTKDTSKLESGKSKRISNITEKLRKEIRLHSQKQRYEVVNLFRNIKPEDTKDDTITPMTFIDIVNHEKTPEEVKEEEYVYDLYYTNIGSDVDEMIRSNTYSILPIHNDLYIGTEDEEDSDHGDDDDDSNDENNIRNEYPDEDELEEDEESIRSDDDYRDEIYGYEEDPDVSGIANDFIGHCKIADSEEDMYPDELSSDAEDEDNIYDEDLVLKNNSYGSYMKKKNKELYQHDIDDEDEYT